MKHISFHSLFLTTVGLYSVTVHATIFEFKYNGNKAVTVGTDTKDYRDYMLSPDNRTARAETSEGFTKIRWVEVANKHTRAHNGGIRYEVTLPNKVGFLNLGGNFTINDGGKYTYDFGVDGKQKDDKTASRN